VSRLPEITRSLFFLFPVLWVTVIFATRFFILPFGAISTFYDNDDNLVIGKLNAWLSVAEEFDQFGGFLHRDDGVPYFSQSGIQGTIFHLAYVGFRDQVTVDAFLTVARVVLALLLAMLLVFTAAKALEIHNLLALAVVVIAMASFRWVVQLSTSASRFIIANYLPFMVFAILQPEGNLERYAALSGGLLMVLGLAALAETQWKFDTASLPALYIATGWAVICSWTWAFLGRNHFQCHSYIAQIVFFIPFGVMFACLVGTLVASLVSKQPGLTD
jgi:hypothetical protein